MLWSGCQALLEADDVGGDTTSGAVVSAASRHGARGLDLGTWAHSFRCFMSESRNNRARVVPWALVQAQEAGVLTRAQGRLGRGPMETRRRKSSCQSWFVVSLGRSCLKCRFGRRGGVGVRRRAVL